MNKTVNSNYAPGNLHSEVSDRGLGTAISFYSISTLQSAVELIKQKVHAQAKQGIHVLLSISR